MPTKSDIYKDLTNFAEGFPQDGNAPAKIGAGSDEWEVISPAPTQSQSGTLGDPDVALGDYVDALQAGGADLMGGLAGITQYAGALTSGAGAETVGEFLEQAGQRGGEYWDQVAKDQVSQMSEEGQKQMSRDFITSGDDSIFGGLGNENTGDAFMLKLIRTSPSILAALVPGTAMAKAGMSAGKVAAGMGAVEGGLGAGFAASQISNTIANMDAAKLSEQFPEEWRDAMLASQNNEKAARQILTRHAVQKGASLSAALSAGTGAVGGALLRKIVPTKGATPSMGGATGLPMLPTPKGRIGRGAQGAVLEGAQESAQEFGQNMGVNLGTNEDLTKGGLEAAVGGAAMGAPIGGGMAAIPGNPQQELPPAPPAAAEEVILEEAPTPPTPTPDADSEYEVVSPAVGPQPPQSSLANRNQAIASIPAQIAAVKSAESDVEELRIPKDEVVLEEAKLALSESFSKKQAAEFQVTDTGTEYVISRPPTESKAPTPDADSSVATDPEPQPVADADAAAAVEFDSESVTEADLPQLDTQGQKAVRQLFDAVSVDQKTPAGKAAAERVTAVKNRIAAGETPTVADVQELLDVINTKGVSAGRKITSKPARQAIKAALSSGDANTIGATMTVLAANMKPKKQAPELYDTSGEKIPLEEAIANELEQNWDERGNIAAADRAERVAEINALPPLQAIKETISDWEQLDQKLGNPNKRTKKGAEKTEIMRGYAEGIAEAHRRFMDAGPEATGMTREVFDAVAQKVLKAKQLMARGTVDSLYQAQAVLSDMNAAPAKTGKRTARTQAAIDNSKKAKKPDAKKTAAKKAKKPDAKKTARTQAAIDKSKSRSEAREAGKSAAKKPDAQPLAVKNVVDSASKADKVTIAEMAQEYADKGMSEAEVIADLEQKIEAQRDSVDTALGLAVSETTDDVAGQMIEGGASIEADKDRAKRRVKATVNVLRESGTSKIKAYITDIDAEYEQAKLIARQLKKKYISRAQRNGVSAIEAERVGEQLYQKARRPAEKSYNDSLKKLVLNGESAVATADKKKEANQFKDIQKRADEAKQKLQNGEITQAEYGQLVADLVTDSDVDAAFGTDSSFEEVSLETLAEQEYLGEQDYTEYAQSEVELGYGDGDLEFNAAAENEVENAVNLLLSAGGDIGWFKSVGEALSNAEGKSVVEVLQTINRRLPAAHPYRVLAGRLISQADTGATFVPVRITSIDASGEVLGQASTAIFTDGELSGIAPTELTLDASLFLENDIGSVATALYAFMHEATHIATVSRMSTDTELSSRISSLMLEFQAARPDLADRYGMTNAFEFVAEAFANPAFQRELAATSIPNPPRRTLRTYWRAFVKAVQDFLGFASVPDSFFAEIVNTVTPKFHMAGFSLNEAQATAAAVNRQLIHNRAVMVDFQPDLVGEALAQVMAPDTELEIDEIMDAASALGYEITYEEAVDTQEAMALSQYDLAPAGLVESEPLRVKPLREAIKKVYGSTSAPFPEKINAVGIGATAKRAGLYFLQWADIVSNFKSMFVVDGVSLMERLDKTFSDKKGIVGRLRKRGEDVLVAMDDFARTEGYSLSEFNEAAVTSTYEGVDPSIPWDSGTNARWAESKDKAIRDAKFRVYNKLRRDLAKSSGGKSAPAVALYKKIVDLYKGYYREEQIYLAKRAIEANAEVFGLVNADGFFDTKAIESLAEELVAVGSKAADSTARRQGIDTALSALIGRTGGGKGFDLKSYTEMSEILAQVLRPAPAGPYIPLRRYGKYAVMARREYTAEEVYASKASAKAAANRVNENADAKVRDNSKATPVENPDGSYSLKIEEMVYELTDNEYQFNRRLQELREEFGDGTVEQSDNGEVSTVVEGYLKPVLDDQLTGNLQGTSAFAEALKNDINRKGGDPELAKFVDKALANLLANRANRASRMQREGVEGASADLQRVIADSINTSSWAIADLRTAGEISQTLAKMTDHAKGYDSENSPTIFAMDVVNHIKKREAHSLDHGRGNTAVEAVEDKLTAFGYYWFLGSVSYSLINATQVALVGAPVMIARYGAKSAIPAMVSEWSRAFKFAGSEMSKRGYGFGGMPNTFMDNYFGNDQNHEDFLGDKSKKGALAQLVDWGLIDATAIQEISRVKKGGKIPSENKAKRAVGGIFDGITTAMRSWPQQMEQINRSTMAAAAYDLEVSAQAKKSIDAISDVDRTKYHTEALAAAKKAIVETQFDYSGSNRPQVMNFRGSRTTLLFKMYGVGMYSLIIRNTFRSLGRNFGKNQNRSDAEIKEARRAVSYLMMAHATAAGALGSIAMEPVRAIAMGLGHLLEAMGMDDDDEIEATWQSDAEQMAYDMASYLIDDKDIAKKAAEIALHGAPRGIGIDLQGRVGLQSLLWMPRTNYTGTAEETGKNLLLGAGGPLVNTFLNGFKAYDMYQQGRIMRALENVSPKALRDISQAIRLSDEGISTSSGEQYMDPLGFVPAVIKATGFSPASVSRTYETRGAQLNLEKKREARRTELRKSWYNAEPKERARIWREHILPFNRMVADDSLRITRTSLVKASRQQRKAEAAQRGGANTKYSSTGRDLGWTQ